MGWQVGPDMLVAKFRDEMHATMDDCVNCSYAYAIQRVVLPTDERSLSVNIYVFI